MNWELLCAFGGIGLLCYALYCQFSNSIRKFRKFPGPSGYPVIGNALDIITNPEELFKMLREYKSYGKVVRLWAFHERVALIYHPDVAEILLSSTKYNMKHLPYNFFHTWLCDGLLVSNGEKWHQRRKMLTPAFHFDVLKQFMKTFVGQTNAMVAKLQQEVGKEQTDPVQLIILTSLNIMCETAMGTRIDEEVAKPIQDYLKTVHVYGQTIVHRITRAFYHLDWFYYLSPNRIQQDAYVRELHKFSEDIIQKRKTHRKKVGFDLTESDGDNVYGKKRMAMLDLLLDNENKGQIDHLGVRAEVDTFMFEGHDTTTMALCLFLMRIANEKDAQNRIYEELQNIFGGDDRDPTIKDLNTMQYLECCIKESLRLYPSVPVIARLLTEDLEIDGKIIPAKTNCLINIYDIHRRADLYPEPERFIPERFLPENITARHRYAYIPFSAGPRNCIGQKFAMMEMKTLISGILRRFKLEPVTRPEDIIFCADMVLRSKDPYYVRIVNRY